MKTTQWKSIQTNVAALAVAAAVLAGLTPLAGGAAFTPGNLAVFSADSATANNTSFTILELHPATAAQGSPVQSIAINGSTNPDALRTSGSATSTGYLSDSDDGTLLVFTGHNTNHATGNVNTNLSRGVGTLDNAGNFTLQTTYTGASGNQTRGASTVNNSHFYVGDQGGIYTNGSAVQTAGNLRAVKSFGGVLYVLQASAGTIVVSTISADAKTVTGLPGLGTDTAATDFYLISSGENGATFDVLYVAAGTAIKKYSLVSGSWTANGSYTASTSIFGLCATRSGSGAVLYGTTGGGALSANQAWKLTDTAGYNSTIAITTGNNVVLYTAATGTTMKGIAFAPCSRPAAAGVITGTSSVCAGTTGGGYSIVAVSGADSYEWTVPAGATIASGQGTTSITVDFGSASGNVAVLPKNDCGSGTIAVLAVTVLPVPNSTISAASSVCPNSTGNIASVPDAGAGAAYGWTITGGSITAGQGTDSITYTAGASGSVELGCAVTNSAGCFSNASSATVMISAEPTTTAGNGGPYCVGQTIALTASGDPGDTYSWTGPDSFASSDQNPTIPNVTAANAGEYTVTRTTACGTSAPAGTTVTINPIPSSAITAASPVCGNSTGNTASVPDAGGGASYGWTITGGSITAGQGTDSITYTAGASGTVQLGCTVTNSSGCYSNASGTTVTINDQPSSVITAASSVLAGSTGHTASVPDAGLGATYLWTIGGGTITDGQGTDSITYTAGAAGTLTLGCTVTANTGCSSVGSANVTVTSPFTPGNLVVLRVGNGLAALSSAGTPVFVDEYTTAGAFVQSHSFPTNGNSALVNSGTASSEGGLMRSPDGTLLCFAGYNTNAGVASVAGTTAASVPRAVGTLNADGNFILVAKAGTQFSGNNVRSAAADGDDNFWAAGANSGTYYVGTASAAATVQSALANTRILNIFNGNLHFSVGTGTARGLYGFSGTPVAAASATQIIDTGGSSSPFAFALNAAGNVAYIADDSALASGGGIQKWTNSAGTWSLAYTLTNANLGSRGLAVDFSGANPVLYTTTTETSANRLVKITDTGDTSSATTLATAPINTAFRGVTFAPVQVSTPPSRPEILSLTFSGSNLTLTWSTLRGTTNFVQAADGLSGFADLSGPIYILGSGSVVTNFTETDGATNTPTRYYRIRAVTTD